MLFWAKSAVCIGLVALAASQGDGGALRAALDDGARDGARDLGRACLAWHDCATVPVAVLASLGAAEPVGPAASSRPGPVRPRGILSPRR